MASFFDQFGKLHAWVYRRNGRLGRRFAWIPTLVVGTTGRKSGDATRVGARLRRRR